MNFKVNQLMLGVIAMNLLFMAPSQSQITNHGAGASSSSSTVGLTVIVPSAMLTNVSAAGGGSTITANEVVANIGSSLNIVGADFIISGTLHNNDRTKTVSCSLDRTTVVLSGPSAAEINVIISGTIGGTEMTTTPQPITMTGNAASIALTGDIDDSTVTLAKPAGTYIGTVTITATQI